MSTIKIRLTKEEQEEFALLPKEQQQAFMDAADRRRKHLMLKTMVLSSILVDSLEEMEEFGLVRFRLKQVGRQYNAELDKIIDNVFDEITNGDKQDSTGYIAQISQAIDKLI